MTTRNPSIRTRFAPSPTGFLHIGGVRTALFNWLLARQNDGQFILRIDDTDTKRNLDQALQPILDGFRWLGIDWDEGPEVGGDRGPYFQSQRLDRYQAAVDRLLERGAAYRDYGSNEEIAQLREEARAAKQDFLYDRRWMAETPADQVRLEREGRQAVVRLKMPRTGQCEFQDRIRGQARFDWAREQDQIIQRTDGSFLYHLASVVDDHDFQISHVVRAVEHFANTPRQIFIAQALGYQLPVYAHLPFVAEPGSQNKLSKRKIEKYMKHREFAKLYQRAATIAERIGLPSDPDSFNPVLVEFYRAIGCEPEAIVNYLLLLGWSLDDKTEDFDRSAMIKYFSLDRVLKSPASFDTAKLAAFQHRYFNRLADGEKVQRVMPFLKRAELVDRVDDPDTIDRTRRVVTAAEDRMTFAGDILQFDYCWREGAAIDYDEAAFEKRICKPADAVKLLAAVHARLQQQEPFVADALEQMLHDFVQQAGIKIGQIIHALRVAVTGKASGFGLFDTLEILTRPVCLVRLERAIDRANSRKEANASS